ncbi:hypothetical protein D0502_03240 [Leuconostoc falkenbergense]|uniref:Integrase catalytic domain-containing protein n=1 Tax=Leuconostoc falkenbergense TaxID=2766470 RepID=A0A9X3E8S1_9LACO|nr:hypothetical protein [Leuconostoc falkenbergense]
MLDVWKTFQFYGYRRLKTYQTLTEVQAAIGWYINFYNRNRISNVA